MACQKHHKDLDHTFLNVHKGEVIKNVFNEMTEMTLLGRIMEQLKRRFLEAS